jgi:fluoroacetyl-CoA thioesterase
LQYLAYPTAALPANRGYILSLVAAYSTPSMIPLMERAGVAAIQRYLSEGQTSVGVEVNIKHLAATPVGMQVTARASLIEIDGGRLKFRVEAWDDKEKIREGLHVRAVPDTHSGLNND